MAQWKAQMAARRPKVAKLLADLRLQGYVQDKLAGVLRGPDGAEILGPDVAPWKGRRKPHRQDRRWSKAWSPEQISNRLPIDFPDDESMRCSHETIYQALFIESRGALKRELVACLRTGRALREPRARTRNRPGGHVTADVVISQRPAEVEDRAVPGHWEGDLIIGLNRSAIGTLVERSTRYTMLVHLPRAEGYGMVAPTKNGPPLGGYGAVAMKEARADFDRMLRDQQKLHDMLASVRQDLEKAHADVMNAVPQTAMPPAATSIKQTRPPDLPYWKAYMDVDPSLTEQEARELAFNDVSGKSGPVGAEEAKAGGPRE